GQESGGEEPEKTVGSRRSAVGRKQKAKGRRPGARFGVLPSAYCLLPTAFCSPRTHRRSRHRQPVESGDEQFIEPPQQGEQDADRVERGIEVVLKVLAVAGP